jgi:DNA-binding CsgD family transcriptional regulator
VARWRGEEALARELVRELLPGGPTTEPGDAWHPGAQVLQRVGAQLALDAGRLDDARAWLEAHDRWLAWSGAVLGRAEGALGWASYHHAAGDDDQARAHAERALAHASEPRQPLALLAARRALGEFATAAGDYAGALAQLDQALVLADACAAPYERALTLLALTELRLATSDRPNAAAMLAEVRAILQPLGAKPALARADALVEHLAAPAAPSRETLPFGLTAREAEVLRLVAQGLGNADIADRLSLSRRTVEQHLRNAYDKLEVENRAAATRLAVERGLA